MSKDRKTPSFRSAIALTVVGLLIGSLLYPLSSSSFLSGRKVNYDSLFSMMPQTANAQSSFTVSISPSGTYLRTNQDSSSSPAIISLAALGAAPGDRLKLTYRLDSGFFSFICGNEDLTVHSADNIGVLGVFSSSNALLSTGNLARIPGAIDAGSDVVTEPTGIDGLTTDISQDFRMFPSAGFEIVIPPSAAYLFLGIADRYFQDNCGPVSATIEKVGDLSVLSVSAIQAPDDPDFLVDGKPTLIKATVSNSFTDLVFVSVKLNPDTPYERTVIDLALQPGTHDYYLPTAEFIVPTIGTSFRPIVELDTDNAITEFEGNNIGSGEQYQIKKSKDLQILYVPLRLTGDTNTDPTCDEVQQVKNASEKYLDSVFPVNPEKTIHLVDCDFPQFDLTPWTPPLDADPNCKGVDNGFPLPGCKVAQLFIALQELTWGKGIDHVVAVTRERWFFQVVQDCDTCLGGVSGRAWPHLPFIHAVIVEKDQLSGASVAHEIAHTYNVRHGFDPAPGYWVTERKSTDQFPNGQNTLDFMHPDQAAERGIIKHWISKAKFNELFDNLKEPGDPIVIGVSGLISKDGAGMITTLMRFEDVLDISLGNTGEYTLLFQDGTGNLLNQTSFDLDFRVSEPENAEMGTAPFALRIPDVPGTEKVVLKHGDQVLAERTFTGPATNSRPIAADDAATTEQGVGVLIDVLSNDSDPDNDRLIIESVTSPTSSGGTAVVENGIIRYNPPSEDYAGNDTFDYTISDGHESGTDTATVTITVRDTAPPEITSFTGSISNGAQYIYGQVPANDMTCTAEDSQSGLDVACIVSGYDTAVGTHTLTATAKDLAGNIATQTITYAVLPWILQGFYSPVDMNSVVNTIKGGQSVPLKFEVFAGTQEKMSTSDITSFTQKRISCSEFTGDPTDAVEELNTLGTGLKYDTTTGQYIANWKTPKSPNTCWEVKVTTADLSTIVAHFRLT